MEALATIIGLGLASFMLFFFSSQLEDKHGLLKLLSLFFTLAMLILIPATLLNAQTVCETVVNTTTVNGNSTTYDYTNYCYENENNTNGLFYNAILWFYRLFIAYVFIYLGWESLQALMNSYKRRGRR